MMLQHSLALQFRLQLLFAEHSFTVITLKWYIRYQECSSSRTGLDGLSARLNGLNESASPLRAITCCTRSSADGLIDSLPSRFHGEALCLNNFPHVAAAVCIIKTVYNCGSTTATDPHVV